MEVKNPFLLNSYISPEYFCNRDKESARIIESIESGRHLTLISERRIGKTVLLKHVFYKLKKQKDYACFYIDIHSTGSLNDFLKMMADGIIGKLDSVPEKAIKMASTFLSNLRPTISVDSLTGEPSVEFDIVRKGKQRETLKEIIQYLDKQKRHIVIAIDEFQQVESYDEKSIEELLRSHFMQSKNISFIFSGSSTHILNAMFGTHNRPFFKSTDIMYLDKIEKNVYKKFIKKHFEKTSKTIPDECMDYVLEWTRTHTWYVQMLCNKLFYLPIKNYSLENITTTCFNTLQENEHVYYSFRNLLSDSQWKLLRAIAKEEFVLQPMAKEFIRKYELGAQSTIQRSLQALVQKEMIVQSEEGYYLLDVFMSRWLERL